MLRVLIADDEEVIRKGIASLVDWSSLGMELVGVAATGGEAYRLLLERQPEIVVTDIKMPEMDGLSLVARAAAEGIETVFVILSGYAEFEFARRAMRYGVRHYLLKPTDEVELSAVLRGIAAEIAANGVDAAGEAAAGPADLPGGVPEHHASHAEEVVKRLAAYVQGHLDHEGLTLQWISENVVYFNPDYLGRLFKRVRGETFSQYLLRERIRAARRLLLEGDLKVSEVAREVGFGPNAQYFSQVFKHHTGVTPREYRVAGRTQAGC